MNPIFAQENALPIFIRQTSSFGIPLILWAQWTWRTIYRRSPTKFYIQNFFLHAGNIFMSIDDVGDTV
jgi:hypothetical protein